MAPCEESPAPDGAADAAKAEALKAEAAAKAEAARKIAASVVADRAAAAARREREDLARGPRPVVAPIVPPPSRSLSRSMLLTVAAVAIMGAVGVARRDLLLGHFSSVRTAQEGQAAQLAPLDRTSAAAGLLAALPSITPAARPAPTTPGRPRVVRPRGEALNTPNASARPVAPDSTATSVPTALPPVATVPSSTERSRSVEAVAPAGRFFEPNDVDVSPTVARRIEPQLPADLKGRPINDIVIVRVLVSQAGDPSRVSLLRKSKQGRSLDDAVVEAVTQWRFSPAKKRGEAVSSWFNIGVPVGQAH